MASISVRSIAYHFDLPVLEFRKRVIFKNEQSEIPT